MTKKLLKKFSPHRFPKSHAIWYLHIAAQSFIMTEYVTNHAALCRATTFKLERMDNK